MGTQLKIVAGNPSVVRGAHLSSRDLHGLADSLTNLVQAGCPQIAHTVASRANLNPLNISIQAGKQGLLFHGQLQVASLRPSLPSMASTLAFMRPPWPAR